MRAINTHYVLTTITVFVASLLTQPAWSADLLSIYNDAIANDAKLASATAKLDAAKESIVQAKAAFYPTIAVTGQASKQKSDTTISSITTNRSTSPRSISLTLTQPLFRAAAYINYKQSELTVAQAEAQFAASQQDLIIRVSQAYFDILSAQDTLSTLAAQKTAIAQQLESAKRNFEVGTATITDQQEAQARYDLVLSQEIAAQNDLLVKQSSLEAIIGKTAPTLSSLRQDVELSPPAPAQLDAWIASTMSSNPSIQSNTLGVELAKRAVQLAQTGHLPTLDLTGSIAKSQQSIFTGGGQSTADIQSNTIGLSLNVPLFAGGNVSSQVSQQQKLMTKAEKDLLDATRTATLITRQTFGGVQSGLAQVKALQAAEKSSQLALDSNKLGYEVGVRINIDVLNSQQQLATTRRDLFKAKYDTLMNGLKLKQAAGTLKADDLGEINAALQR